MPRDAAIIFADPIGKLNAPYKSSKAWLKIKNPNAAVTQAIEATFELLRNLFGIYELNRRRWPKLLQWRPLIQIRTLKLARCSMS
jgi:hypothetical protein